MTQEELEQLQTTNEILHELRTDLLLEAQDASGQGDRVGAKILERVVNALTRNMDRRAAREESPAVVVETSPISLDDAAAKAANKGKAN